MLLNEAEIWCKVTCRPEISWATVIWSTFHLSHAGSKKLLQYSENDSGIASSRAELPLFRNLRRKLTVARSHNFLFPGSISRNLRLYKRRGAHVCAGVQAAVAGRVLRNGSVGLPWHQITEKSPRESSTFLHTCDDVAWRQWIITGNGQFFWSHQTFAAACRLTNGFSRHAVNSCKQR